MKPPRYLYLDEWETPAHSYPRQKLGCAEIKAYRITKGVYPMYGVSGFDYFKAEAPLTDIQLKIRGKTWMVSDPLHWKSMLEHADKYHGHVLCAGLGLGLIIHALCDNRRVKQITVIERERDVINLVGPQLPRDNRIKILHGDFWDLDPWVMDKVDGVFYDLFVGDGPKLYPQALRVWFQLHEKWPDAVRRIHGFNNEQLESLDGLLERT
ncbi:class I SAM-dependent methyltransferase [Patescibacteria group bacterium]|nr:class I SAM-dependent methyltransferase [Patescibacteria group bacterium]